MDVSEFRRRAKDLGWTQQKLAGALGITQGAVGQWRRIPVERCADIERLVGIPCHELRPDIFRPHLAEERNDVPGEAAEAARDGQVAA